MVHVTPQDWDTLRNLGCSFKLVHHKTNAGTSIIAEIWHLASNALHCKATGLSEAEAVAAAVKVARSTSAPKTVAAVLADREQEIAELRRRLAEAEQAATPKKDKK